MIGHIACDGSIWELAEGNALCVAMNLSTSQNVDIICTCVDDALGLRDRSGVLERCTDLRDARWRYYRCRCWVVCVCTRLRSGFLFSSKRRMVS